MGISIQSVFPSLSLSPPPPSKENAWGGTRREVVAGSNSAICHCHDSSEIQDYKKEQLKG